MARSRASLSEIRSFFARQMAAASNSADPRLERIFELVPREAFMPPGPWHMMVNQRYLETPSADPAYLYQNALFALKAEKRINNGEPFLHAAWIGAAAPQGGESICHIGAGSGYYTALLSMLTLPGGSVTAFEIDRDLFELARMNLAPFESVDVVHADATRRRLPSSDLVYVNAAVVAPPVSWLEALKPNGRIIFPWHLGKSGSLAVIVRRETIAFSVRPLMPSWFIPCVGASDDVESRKVPSLQEAYAAKSLWLATTREPDQTAVAIYRDIWVSNAPISGTP